MAGLRIQANRVHRALAVWFVSAVFAGLTAAQSPDLAPSDPAVVAIELERLGGFDYDPIAGGNIPAAILALDGRRIRIRGWMVPWQREGDRISTFALCEGQGDCCGDAPPIQRIVVCRYPAGIDVAEIIHPVEVEGPLTIAERRFDGWMAVPFTLEATNVIGVDDDAPSCYSH